MMNDFLLLNAINIFQYSMSKKLR